MHKKEYLMFRKLLIILACLIFWGVTPAFASSASLYYSDGPWSGKIIDSETKKPIEGVVVLAVWQKVYATPAGDNSYFFDAVEVLTDKEGNFFIPKFRALNIIPVIRSIRGPRFIIYKPSYPAFPGFGAQYFDKYFSENLKVDADVLNELLKKGIVLELPKLKTWIERIESHESADIDGEIPDSKIPKFKQVLKEEDNYLKPMYRFDRKKLNIPVGALPK